LKNKSPIPRFVKTKRYPEGTTKKPNKIDMTAIEGPMLNREISLEMVGYLL
jgi:hypothetical protein